ncbi:MAG: hypothetical protein ACPGJS_19305 [Flammeovirgaceae bacterium]
MQIQIIQTVTGLMFAWYWNMRTNLRPFPESTMYQSFLPLPPFVKIYMRLLSISLTFRLVTSPSRKPAE